MARSNQRLALASQLVGVLDLFLQEFRLATYSTNAWVGALLKHACTHRGNTQHKTWSGTLLKHRNIPLYTHL